MKVCFLAGTLGQGGAERQLLYMLQALQKSGAEARVMCLTKGEIYQSRIESLGIEVDFVGEQSSRLRRLSKIAANLKSKPAEIVQSAHFYTNIYAAITGKCLGIRSIGAVRNDLTSEISADRIFGAWQARLPENLIANTSAAIERAKSLGIAPQKLNFVKNVVSLPSNHETAQKKSANRLNVLFVGRLTVQKRPEIFVELANYLKRSGTQRKFHFQMIGDGLLLDDLKRQVSELNLSDEDITFYGDRQDVSNFYRNADLLVLPSIYEGTPNVLLEAMSFGIPVVSTRVGGIPEIITNERGILVDAADIKGLFEASKKLLENDELRQRLGAEGKKYVALNHSLDYLQSRLTEIYDKILN